jgi:transposase
VTKVNCSTSFSLAMAVPEDHLVRKIDTALDLSWLRSELAPHYSSMGRPSIDPELMIRMLVVVGYVFAIRSERLICREVQVNLAYRWFCRLRIEDAIPDHSAFVRARNERFREEEIFPWMFERVVEASIAAGLVGGEGFAVDASLIQADANKQRSIASQDWCRDRDPKRSSRAVKEYLATLDDTAWGAASDVVPKFVSPSDPVTPVDRGSQGTGILCLLRQLSHRCKVRRHRRCRGFSRHSAGRGWRGEDHDRANIEALWSQAGAVCRRYRLRCGSDAELAGRGQGHRATYPWFDKSKRDDGTFSRSDFRYDPTGDVYHRRRGHS